MAIEIVDVARLRALLDADSGVVLIDARRPEDYEEAHLPGALLGTSDTIIERAAELAPDRAATVVTYCGSHSCRRSERAAERLEGLGYENVVEFAGGLEEWQDAGFPVESGAAA